MSSCQQKVEEIMKALDPEWIPCFNCKTWINPIDKLQFVREMASFQTGYLCDNCWNELEDES